MTELGRRLIQAAHEAAAIARGEADPSTYRVHTPPNIDVKAIRRKLRLTQSAFAERYRFPIERLRDLERGKVWPDSSTQAYLTVISREPEAVQRALETA